MDRLLEGGRGEEGTGSGFDGRGQTWASAGARPPAWPGAGLSKASMVGAEMLRVCCHTCPSD